MKIKLRVCGRRREEDQRWLTPSHSSTALNTPRGASRVSGKAIVISSSPRRPAAAQQMKRTPCLARRCTDGRRSSLHRVAHSKTQKMMTRKTLP
ncbi:hypothetical protein E2C01_088121 [Portunus trituberculatus]|uniref:Uncharacterized protein n=1 Tax=Portunus trituberculatus TaxID=210409 RepID=A0A5B7JFU2_PORTR|nr:hypothetical protein [Portunus trituberculatus]